MTNYPQLIQQIQSPNKQQQIETLKKLHHLSTIDKNKFSQFLPHLMKQLSQTLAHSKDQQLKLFILQFLSQLTSNHTPKIPIHSYNFAQYSILLSDPNAEIRKASHYLILVFIKKYHQIDEVLSAYLARIHEVPQQWKVHQKIIHSFQSLIVIEPKCVTHCHNYAYLDHFLKLLLENSNHEHNLIKKASQQANISLIQTINSFIKNQYVLQILPKLHKNIIAQLLQSAKQINIDLQPYISISPSKYHPTKTTNPNPTLSKLPTPNTTHLPQLLQKLDEQTDSKIKLSAIQQISNLLLSNNLDISDDLIQKVLDLVYDYNFDICITAITVLLNIVTRYPNQITNKMKQIEGVTIDKICDLKIAVRQFACCILKLIYPTKSKDFLKRLLTKLNNCSIVGKEEILNFFQETPMGNLGNDLHLILGEVSNQLLNENARIKIKAIDCLIHISGMNDLEQCKMILARKLNKVYYDMFLQRLGNRITTDKQESSRKNQKKGKTSLLPSRTSSPSPDPIPKTIHPPSKKPPNQNNHENSLTGNPYKHDQKFSNSSRNSCRTSRTFKSLQDSNYYHYSKKNMHAKRVAKQYEILNSNCSFVTSVDDEIKPKQYDRKISMNVTPIKNKTNIQPSQKQCSPISQPSQYKIIKREENKTEHINKNKPKTEQLLEKPLSQKKLQKSQTKPQKVSTKEKQQQQENDDLQQTSKIPFSPLSTRKQIPKKKQHIIDYKATHYITKDQLSPLKDPKQTLKIILTNLPKDNDWKKQFDSLDLLRRLIKHNEDLYSTITQNLSIIMPQLLKLLQSLRSCVSKNAMIALSQMCQSLKKSMDPYLQLIFGKLFKKSLDTNTFIGEQVRRCIGHLCAYCSSTKICAIISSNVGIKAVPVKLSVMHCIDRILQKNQYNCQILKQNPKIIGVMGTMVVDSSSDVRSLTKQIFLQLLENNTQEIQSLFKKYSAKDAQQKWKNIVDKQYLGSRK